MSAFAESRSMIGRTLSHYRILAKIGEGGMGAVYRARDLKLKREVAIKVLPPEVSTIPERVQRFQREAETLARLDHPNIVHLYSLEEDEGIRFLTMQMVDGRPLDELIPADGLPAEEIFKLAIPLADAMAAAHERGIIHRDLKPANVLVTREDQVKVLDFGLAKLREVSEDVDRTALMTEGITQEGGIVGTVPYMAPEQLQGRGVDLRTDVHALGVVLYEMATGRRPFAGESSADLISTILRDVPRPIPETRQDLPHHFGRIVRRCLEKDPDRRYGSARDVRNELDDLAREVRADSLPEVRPALRTEADPASRARWLLPLLIGAALFVLLVGLYWYSRVREQAPAGARVAAVESIAVLPFQNLMHDPEQDYFVEGIHEALITDLAKISSLRVISRTSVMRFKDGQASLPEIAQQLNADALVQGSVLRADGQLRVTTQLIDGRSDEHLWAESYDREIENVLVLLSELARSIAAEIEVTLTPEQERLLASAGSIDPEAHEAYLRGRHSFHRFTPDGYFKAVEYFQQAIEIEPDYVEAHAGLGACHLLIAGFGIADRETHEALTRMYLARTLELDPENVTALAGSGWIKLYFDWDWEGAAAEFRRALRLNPYEPYACHGYADYLTLMDRQDEAIEYLKRAARADPLSPLVNSPVAAHLVMARRYEEAVDVARQLLQMDPDFPAARALLSQALWFQESYDEALLEYRMRWRDEPELLTALEEGFEVGGPREAMRRVAEVLASRAESGRPGALDVATAYAKAGESDAAFEWLDRAVAERVPQLMLLRQEPRWDLIREDPRFAELTRSIGLPSVESP